MTSDEMVTQFLSSLEKKSMDQGAIWEYKDDIKKLMIKFARKHLIEIQNLQEAKFYAGETGYIPKSEFIEIIKKIE